MEWARFGGNAGGRREADSAPRPIHRGRRQTMVLRRQLVLRRHHRYVGLTEFQRFALSACSGAKDNGSLAHRQAAGNSPKPSPLKRSVDTRAASSSFYRSASTDEEILISPGRSTVGLGTARAVRASAGRRPAAWRGSGPSASSDDKKRSSRSTSSRIRPCRHCGRRSGCLASMRPSRSESSRRSIRPIMPQQRRLGLPLMHHHDRGRITHERKSPRHHAVQHESQAVQSFVIGCVRLGDSDSGGMYSGVPAHSAVGPFGETLVGRTKPRSRSFTSPPKVMKTFCGLISPCANRRVSRSLHPVGALPGDPHRPPQRKGPRPIAPPPTCDRDPFEDQIGDLRRRLAFEHFSRC